MRKNTMLYLGLAALGWYFYQKKQGNNFLGAPLAVTPASVAALAASSAANLPGAPAPIVVATS